MQLLGLIEMDLKSAKRHLCFADSHFPPFMTTGYEENVDKNSAFVFFQMCFQSQQIVLSVNWFSSLSICTCLNN